MRNVSAGQGGGEGLIVLSGLCVGAGILAPMIDDDMPLSNKNRAHSSGILEKRYGNEVFIQKEPEHLNYRAISVLFEV